MDFIDHWHIWLIFAFVILIVELMSGTYFLLAVAGGGFLTSLTTLWLEPTFTVQFICFALTSAATYLLLLSFRKEKSDINSDGTSHMIGQRVEVLEEINPQGRVTYKGVLWQARSDEIITAKSYAEIIAVNGSTVTVKAIH